MTQQEIVGFDTTTRRWATHPAPQDNVQPLPDLSGSLLTAPGDLNYCARDFGNSVKTQPAAVLRPTTVEDIQNMVRFARSCALPVTARGQGHSTFGQSQAEAGLVIDMSSLNAIHRLDPHAADVDAGVTWRRLVEASVPRGATPPVLPGYLGLTVGGTLSVGGISSSYARGAQVDHVKELQVVTGLGDIESCSRTHNAELFDATLASLGQCALITRAVVELVPAKQSARTFVLEYSDNAQFFEDFRTLLNRGEFDNVFCLWSRRDEGYEYRLNATQLVDAGEEANADWLLRGLSRSASEAAVSEAPYLTHLLEDDLAIETLEARGLFRDVQHPWFDVWLPDESVESYVGEVIASLRADDVGSTGFLLLIPQKRSALTRPFLMVPDDTEWVYLFDILTAHEVAGADPEFEARMLSRNRRLFDEARKVGGTRYPIGSVAFEKEDWIRHYGERYRDFVTLKARYDPDGILAPAIGTV